MPPTPRLRRPIAPALAFVALALTARPAEADDPRPYRHNPVQTAARYVLHRETARPLPLSGYAGYNYAEAPQRPPVPTVAARRPHSLPFGLGRLFHHP